MSYNNNKQHESIPGKKSFFEELRNNELTPYEYSPEYSRVKETIISLGVLHNKDERNKSVLATSYMKRFGYSAKDLEILN